MQTDKKKREGVQVLLTRSVIKNICEFCWESVCSFYISGYWKYNDQPTHTCHSDTHRMQSKNERSGKPEEKKHGHKWWWESELVHTNASCHWYSFDDCTIACFRFSIPYAWLAIYLSIDIGIWYSMHCFIHLFCCRCWCYCWSFCCQLFVIKYCFVHFVLLLIRWSKFIGMENR